MKRLRRCLSALLCVASLLSLGSCFFDMGEGADENAFFDYFSGVLLLSQAGRLKEEKIETFSADISIEDEGMKEVVVHDNYAYIAFCVAGGYTLTVEDFVFFARTAGDTAELSLDFFISDGLPPLLEGGDGEASGGFEDIFTEPGYAHAALSLSGEWNSTHLEFDEPQTVREHQFIIVRVNNNSYIPEATPDEDAPLRPLPIAFTFNYLLFRFTNVTKK